MQGPWHVHVIPVHCFYDLAPTEVMEKQDAQPPAADEQLASVAQDLRRYLTTHVSFSPGVRQSN